MPTRPELNPVSVAWSNWEYCYFPPLEGILVHRWLTPAICCRYPFYTPGWRETMLGSFFSKETTRWQGLGLEPPTFRPEVQRANHYTTAPPPFLFSRYFLQQTFCINTVLAAFAIASGCPCSSTIKDLTDFKTSFKDWSVAMVTDLSLSFVITVIKVGMAVLSIRCTTKEQDMLS